MRLEQLRALCLSFPGAWEDLKWGADICFCVGKKMFAVTGVDGGGLSLKVEEPLFHFLTGKPGVIPAPYLARYHWVLVEDRQAVSEDELARLIRGSYDLVLEGLPAKERRGLVESAPVAVHAPIVPAKRKALVKKRASKKKTRAAGRRAAVAKGRSASKLKRPAKKNLK